MAAWLLVLLPVWLAAGVAGCGGEKKREEVATQRQALEDVDDWQPNTAYDVGDRVRYLGVVYEARQAHTSAPGWEPLDNYSLWQRPYPGSPPQEWQTQTHYPAEGGAYCEGQLYAAYHDHVSEPHQSPCTTPTLWRPAATSCIGLPDGQLCDDGVTCTIDVCQGGQCVSTPTAACGPTENDVGTLGGDISVGPDGTASYVVPLWTPEGRNGMSPRLRMSYSSGRSDGVAGVGWALQGGTSMIHRCTEGGLRHARPRPVTFGDNDEDGFCLDGQPLIPVGALHGVAGAEYRTEPDSFARVRIESFDNAAGAPARWEVRTRDGLIHSYGQDPGGNDSSLFVEGSRQAWSIQDDDPNLDRLDSFVTNTPSAARYGWLRGSVADRFSNAMSFRYGHPADRGTATGAQEPLLEAIEYVDVAGVPTRFIRFQYIDRENAGSTRSTFRGGMRFSSSKLLDAIDVLVTEPGSQNPSSVRFYDLAYENSPQTGRPLLASLEECDGNPQTVTDRQVSCKRPTALTYEAGSEGFEDVATGFTDLRKPDDSSFWGLQVADLDQDGRDDIIYRKRPDGASPSTPPRWYYRLSTGGGFGPAVDMGVPSNTLPADLVIADFILSDGYPDVMVPTGINVYTDFRNLGTGFATGNAFGSIFEQVTGPNWGIQIGDFAGKGQISILRPKQDLNSWGFRIYKDLDTSALSGNLLCSWRDPSEGWMGFALDADGDGVSEFLTLPPQAGAGNYLTRMTQAGVVDPVPPPGESPPDVWLYLSTTLLSSKQGDQVKYIVFDHNGDGLSDLLRLRQANPATPDLIINSGNGFAQPNSMGLEGTPAANVALGSGTVARDLVDPGIRILDFDGDGRQDILLVDDGSKRDSTAPAGSASRTHLTVLLSRGDGSFETKTLAIPVGASASGPNPPPAAHVANWRLSRLLDANGDGLTDIVQVSAADNTLHLYLRQGKKVDLLTRVRDGMGKKTNVTYNSMLDPALEPSDQIYAPGTSCTFPQRCLKRGGWLVGSFRVDNGIGTAQNEFHFKYEDGRVDLQGSGGLGFSKWTMNDVASGTIVTQSFDQATKEPIPKLGGEPGTVEIYSRLGLPAERAIETTEGTVIRRTSTTFGFELVQTNGGKSYYARPTAVATLREEEGPGGAVQLSNDVSTFSYDPAHDNLGILSGVSSTLTLVDGVHESSWSSQFDSHESIWLLGLENRRTITSAAPTEGPITRLMTFTRSPTTGALDSMEVEPETGTPDEYALIAYGRTSHGQVTTITRTDQSGVARVDAVGYDSQSVHAKTYTNALGHVTTLDTDAALGVVTSTTDANDVVTSFDYDHFGRLLRVSYPGGGGMSLSYTREVEPGAEGDSEEDRRDVTRVETTHDGGGEIRTLVNRLGQEIRREVKNLDATFSFVNRSYDDLGLLAGLTRPAKVGTSEGAETTWLFDNLGRLVQRTRPEDGRNSDDSAAPFAAATYTYEGLLATATDDFGRLTRFNDDGFGRVIKSESRNDAGQWLPTEYTYGPFGVLRFVTRKNGAGADPRVTEASYDKLGRRIFMSDPDTGTRTFRYNAFGEIREEVDASGSLTTFTRDALGRTTQRVDKDGTTTFIWDTAANGKGKIAKTTSPSGVERRFFYDTHGRLNREKWLMVGQTFQVDYSFDSHGRLEKVTYPAAGSAGRLVTRNIYDPDSGALAKIQNDATSALYWELRETEVNGRVKKEKFGNEVLTDYEYTSTTQRLSEIRSTKGSTTLRHWDYDYWKDGNLRRRSDLIAGQHERFEYDNLDRIKKWMAANVSGSPMSGGWAVNYEIDDFGNITRRHFVAGSTTGGTSQDLLFTMQGGSNRVATSPWGNYSYDANGNQIGRPENETISYTAFDLPKQITGPRGTEFLYDAFGIRAKKRKSGTDYTLYVSDLYEKRVNGAAVEHVHYVLARGRAVAQVTREGSLEQVAYLHADRLGSVDTVTGTAGDIIEQTKRDPFGNAVTNFNQPKLPMTIGASSNDVRLGFTGHEQDDELGLINMRGRMYDPRLGRFLTTDPFVSAPLLGQSYNRYAYVFNNPTGFTDPSGFQAETDLCDFGVQDPTCGSSEPDEEPNPGHEWREDGNGGWIQVCVSSICAVGVTVTQTAEPTVAVGGGAITGTNPNVSEPETSSGGAAEPPSGTPAPAASADGNGQAQETGKGMAAAATTVATMPRPIARPTAPGFLNRALGRAATFLSDLKVGISATLTGLAAGVAVLLYSPAPSTAIRDFDDNNWKDVISTKGLEMAGPMRGEGEPSVMSPGEQAAREAELTGEIESLGQAVEELEREVVDRINEGDFQGAREAAQAADRARAEKGAAEVEREGVRRR